MNKQQIILICLVFLTVFGLQAQTIPFTTDNWQLMGGQAIEKEGQQAYMGNAMLKDVEFLNGTIEVDVFVTGQRSFPGIFFRMQDGGNYELFYIRPHKLDGMHFDALQYTPVFHNVSCWQLYHGEGYTKEVVMPAKEWVQLKIEVSGSKAQVYVGDRPQASLVIHQLEQAVKGGRIGGYGPSNGTAYFANFSYSSDDPKLEPSTPKPPVPGIIKVWEISTPITGNLVDPYTLPDEVITKSLEWKKVLADPSGLVNLTRELTRNPVQPGWSLAKTSLFAQEAGVKRISVGYSDFVTVFLNGQAIFTGNSAFRSRDPGFSGVIGYNDEIQLPLLAGDNELLLMVGENMGGWGFQVVESESIDHSPHLSMQWELDKQLDYPESAEYDPIRQVIYVSNNLRRPTESISLISAEGELINKDWAVGLFSPTGLFLDGNELFVVERQNVAVVNTETGKILRRIALPGALFPNDITGHAEKDEYYVSDSRRNVIYKIANDQAIVWMQGGALIQPNGLYVQKDRILVGCSGYPALLSVDLQDQESQVLHTVFPGAVMDGIQVTASGHILFGDWQGSLYEMDPSGRVEEILNTRTPGINLADFKWVEEDQVLIIPTLYDNRVMLWNYLLNK